MTVTMSFDTPVILAPGALSITRHEPGGGATPIPFTIANPSHDQMTYVLEFGGQSLADGIYDLRATAAAIKNLGRAAMPADFTFEFHRLFGDANGDRVVDAFDLNLLTANWQAGTPSEVAVADLNLDGRVDAFDLNILASRWQAGVGGG
jgi:hypothetical protein